MNMGIDYLGQFHGEADLREYLVTFTKNVYRPVMEQMRSDPFGALAEKIRSTYAAEKAEDALKLTQTDNTLTVEIAYCPAVKHLHATGREVCQWFPLSTTVVMETMAAAGGLRFEMEHYDPATGAARYRFFKEEL